MTEVALDAWSTALVRDLSRAQAAALEATGAVSVAPGWETDSWTVTATSLVGVLSVEGATLRIRPRMRISRLLFLLGYAQDPRTWREDPVGLDDAADLWPAMAQLFVRQVDRALQRGLLQGYRTEEAASLVLRGRLREADQQRLHAGLITPLEIRYDEYDVDVLENQLLRAAAERLIRVPRLNPVAARALRRQVVGFADVRRLVPGQRLPLTPSSRLNARYQPALALARLVLAGRSVDVVSAGVRATGLLVDMNRVFEDFVTTALSEVFAGMRLRPAPQDRHHLDEGHRVVLRPDLVVYDGPRPVAVLDAKYKAEKRGGFPNEDVYQLLAYCTALQLPSGHLVYAKGEEIASVADVRHVGVQIMQHALDLTAPVTELMGQISAIAGQAVGLHPFSLAGRHTASPNWLARPNAAGALARLPEFGVGPWMGSTSPPAPDR